MGERGFACGERVDCVDHHLLRDPAHFGDLPLEQVEVLVVRPDGVLVVHHGFPP